MAVNVFPINENLSRQALLSWVNNKLSSKFLKIEEFCSGVAYCQLMDQLYPGIISMKKVKTNTKMEYAYIINLKILQEAFNKLSVEKVVPIEKLIKGRFQDNFEFMVWFKRFYDAHCVSASNQNGSSSTSSTRHSVDCTSVPQKGFDSIRSQEVELNCELKNLEEKISNVRYARDFYLSKINQIQIICQDFEENPLCCKLLEILQKKEVDPSISIMNETFNADDPGDIDQQTV